MVFITSMLVIHPPHPGFIFFSRSELGNMCIHYFYYVKNDQTAYYYLLNFYFVLNIVLHMNSKINKVKSLSLGINNLVHHSLVTKLTILYCIV